MGTTLPSCSRSVAGVGSRAPLIGRGPAIANTTAPPTVHISGGNYRHKLLKSLCAAVNFESLSDQLNCPGIRSRLLVSQNGLRCNRATCSRRHLAWPLRGALVPRMSRQGSTLVFRLGIFSVTDL